MKPLWRRFCFALAATIFVACPHDGWAQEGEPAAGAEAEASSLLSAEDLEVLVVRIALYPDEVVAVILPASTYPLDIVQAARFLEQQKSKPDAEPNANWDQSVLALINYPVVVAMMNEDLDWTTILGEAVLNQQGDVMDAIQQVRRSAYAEGYLESDDRNVVTFEKDTVEIVPASPNVIYLPIYTEPPAATTTEVTNNYYASQPVYSEPYTPYYNQAASFWTGALVGGLTVGFLMNWDDDDIDFDFNDGNFDDWHPGRGNNEINIDGDVNIGNDVNIGDNIKVGKGDSWRQAREQKISNGAVPQISTRNPKRVQAQPAANLGAKTAKGGTAGLATQPVKKKPAQVGAKTKIPESRKPAQKPGALGNVERGQDAVKASKRGTQSQLGQQQSGSLKKPPTAAKSRNTGSKAFGGMSSGQKTNKASARGSGSMKKRSRR